MNMNLTHVDCLIVDGTEEELQALTDTENAYRRHNTTEQREALARLVKRATPSLPVTMPEPDKQTRGRPKGAKTKAIEKVAEATGKSESTVRRAVQQTEAPKPPEPEPIRPVIDDMGLDLPSDVLEATAAEHEIMTDLAQSLSQLQRNLTRHEGATGRTSQPLHEALHRAASIARGLTPKSVCLYCKLVPTVRKGCLGCKGTGWLTSDQIKGIGGNGVDGMNLFERLTERGDRMGIYHAGKWLTMGEARKL
jgi:hypothetical protein